MANFENFTNLYSISKTLRFELKPIGKTKDNIEKNGLIAEDNHRADSYKRVKKLIDEYHRSFIEESLSKCKLSETLLERYKTLYKTNKNDENKDDFDEISKQLRKEIVSCFQNNEKFKNLHKKELITQELPQSSIIKNEEDKKLVESFKTFTTYFNGFNTNRQNIYTYEEKSSSIAYRLIHENLPKFIDNGIVFEKFLLNNPTNGAVKVGNPQIFQLNYFNKVLSQAQIDSYNTIIGNLNLSINLYNQQQKEKSARIPKFKTLFKQILSENIENKEINIEINSKEEVLESVIRCYEELIPTVEKIKELLSSLETYDTNKIFLTNDNQLKKISQRVYNDYGEINRKLLNNLRKENPNKKKENEILYEESLNNIIRKQKSVSIEQCQEKGNKDIVKYFSSFGEKEGVNLLDKIEQTYNELNKEELEVESLKNFLDALKGLQLFVKPLCDKGEQPDKDENFYGEFTPLWENLNKITTLYNAVRNQVTKKLSQTKKIKLNFNISGLLGGWVDSQTDKSDNGTQYGGYLFRKKNSIDEYDGISINKKLFRDKAPFNEEQNKFERLNYYQPKSQTIYGSSYKGENTYDIDKQKLIEAISQFIDSKEENDITKEIKKKFAKGKTDPTPKGMITILKNYPEYYKELLKDKTFAKENKRITKILHETLCSFSRIPKALNYKDTKFTLFSEVQEVIDEICNEKVFDYFPISDDSINEAFDSGVFYLFQITNKDLSFAENFTKGIRKSRGTENLHTLYFKQMMSGMQSTIDIGAGEVFFRETVEKNPVIHKANQSIDNKYVYHDKTTSEFSYDIIKNKHYTTDKYLLHLSINLNFSAKKENKFNEKAQDYIRNSKDLHIIGIDRGERNLLYLTMIDLKGNIKKHFSLNEIINEHNGVKYETDYHRLLKDKEDKRNKERKTWQPIENIKDLKEGYLSQAIHEISNLMIKYNAIVVLEDLNPGFKRGRQKFEHSVYQKFEKMLIDKLNYLADKKKNPQEIGGLLKAYQLTNQFKSFKELGKQSGFLFYTQAWNTSKIDPVTGFVNLFDTRYTNKENARKFFSNFEDIRFNKEKNYFEFEFDYSKFTNKYKESKQHWIVCTFGERIETFRNPENNSQWDNKTIDLTQEFKNFFEEKNIDCSNLKAEIVKQESKEFFEKLLKLFRLTLQMRNSISNTEEDYIISPIANEKGVFYNSKECDDSLPKDADANGAYNIARKGLLIVEKIKAHKKGSRLDLAISNEEWLKFAQGIKQ